MATRTKHLIGGYRVVAPIGVGASATVYRALNEETKAEVAIKVLAENHSLLPEMRQRFHDEVELLAAIDTPSVAKIYELGETDSGQPFMVLELADRGDLRHRVEELRTVGETAGRHDLLELAEHLAEGLGALHKADIIHRDVSPGNVLIRSERTGSRARLPTGEAGLGSVLEPGERFLLADLGFAKDLEYASGLTAGGGTRGFAAPEQRDEVTVVDHRADIFSATAIVEWLAQGSGLVNELDSFLDVGLASDPGLRFDSMDAWLSALKQSLGVEGSKPATGGLADTGANAKADELAAAASGPMVGRATLAAAGAAVLVGLVAAAFALQPSELGDDGADAEEVAAPATVDGGEQVADAEAEEAQGASSASAPLADDAAGETAPGAEDDESSTSVSTATSSAPAPDETDPSPTTSGTDNPSPSSPDTTAPRSTTLPPTTAASTTTTARVTTTASPTTTAPPNSVTTQALTTTTFSPVFVGSPRAYVNTPTDEQIISGDLRITGVAEYSRGVVGVTLVIRDEETDLVWHDSTKSFRPDWIRFPVAVQPANATEVTWSYTIDADSIPPGRYLVRVWATGTDANDPVSNQHHVTITD